MTRAEWMAADMAELRKRWGGRCQECGATDNRQFSHERPTGLCGRGRGMRQRWADIVKYPDHYRLRCPRCHRRRDTRQPGGLLCEPWLRRKKRSPLARVLVELEERDRGVGGPPAAARGNEQGG